VYRLCDIYLYASNFPESDCVSLSKALMANCRCCFTTNGALAEKAEYSSYSVSLQSPTATILATEFEIDDETYASLEMTLVQCIHDHLRYGKHTERNIDLNRFDSMCVSTEWLTQINKCGH